MVYQMRKRLTTEGIQMIHVGTGTTLTPHVINTALLRARSNFMYAKFYTDKFFIQVNFMKDGTINVATNIRLPACVNNLWKMNQLGWTFARAKNFVYQWMQLSRRLIQQ